MIEKQIELLQQFITDPNYSFLVADNSSVPEKRLLIQEVCRKKGVGYISLPDNLLIKYCGDGYSHGASLNWIYYNYLSKRKAAIFGFIDHDLFPIAPISLKAKLGDSDFYGPIRDREQGWYIWAGLSFFKYDAVKLVKLNFIPYVINGVFLDTGGSNYPILYKHYNKELLHDLTITNVSLEEKETMDYHTDYLQFIDHCWLHLINGSNWKRIAEESQQKKEQILNEIVQDPASIKRYISMP